MNYISLSKNVSPVVIRLRQTVFPIGNLDFIPDFKIL